LPATRILPGRDFANFDLDPTPGPQRYHGMSCASIIAASHTTDSLSGLSTTSGVISLASQVNVIPVKIIRDFGGLGSTSALAQAITWAWQNDADVLSNSWVLDYPCPGFDNITDAINGAAQFGRDGRGCPVIFASGNLDIGGNVAFPACHPLAMAVGAIQLDDVRWYYSNYDSTLDIVAPSGDANLLGDVWTMDQMGTLGINPTSVSSCPSGSNDVDYYCKFGGTSAACPVVAGVAALLISKDTNLTRQQVYTILDSSAVTALDWGTITPPNNQYGWGRVDAFRAILSISRGDANNDGVNGNVVDLNFIVQDIFQGGSEPFPSPKMGDCNCDGIYNIIDLNYMVNRIFRGGPSPVNPCYKF